ncbi:DUF2306 domain-containing protein [Paenibacillus sp. MMS18-CY102]|uniref:DUF2306 domain-containing protein n=1 Tax=Paenibacillus sp. MMS18-CY102 TaxID=2682849 RepID=UPI0013663B05|nr:DUF2306 domain-containing protein [Paenibacillus sp. MMS18-CY102]MWC30928.1 DUF2306 domain-containing protein [Paenibacillus sp. MMS18-CY102]
MNNNHKRLYALMACVTVLFILYALVNNYIIDPGAEHFLSHKAGLKRQPKLPIWLNVMYIHVAFACVAMAAGLLNFSERLRESSRKFHRINGYVYAGAVLLVVLTSGYMAPYATGGKISSMGFNALNLIWIFVTITAIVQIKRKRIIQHRHWMIRSYAFCFTNLLIHLLTAILQQGFGLDYVASYTISIYGAIALLLVVPSFWIRVFKLG